MAFKTVESYNEARFGGFFLLRNDGDFADVVFMYRNKDDVLVADTHYVKGSDYSGYVHCCGRGCPACSKGIRVQTKLFIPVYNINEKKIQFWDRTMRFEPQLMNDVFKNFPDPSNYVFRITRHGQAGSVDTTYEIQAIGRNNIMSYSDILAANNASSPDYYSEVCKEYDAASLSELINQQSEGNNNVSPSSLPSYQVKPRSTSNAPEYVPPAVELPDENEPVGTPEELDDDVVF